jgi:hypothetical protein
MKLSEVHLTDATLTLIGPAEGDPPVIGDDELRSLRELQRGRDDPDACYLIASAVLERIIETIAIGNARVRHAQ